MKLRVKFPLLIALVVAAALGVTGYFTASFQNDLVISQAERQARMLSLQILLTRRWVTDHEGVFVTKKPASGGTAESSAGDVVDKSGQVYVKRNPGMIITDLSDYSAQADFCRFRVTSLRPLNPANTPDDFERSALLDFETGRKEASEIRLGKQGRILRYIIPLKVEESCLPCHAEHGYQVGNIRGGLSLEVPLGWADEAIEANNRLLLLVGGLAVGVAALLAFLLIDSQVVRRLAALGGAIRRYPRLVPPGELPAGSDEIAELSGNFSEMDERLGGGQAELILIKEQLFQEEEQAEIARQAAAIAHEIGDPLSLMRDSLEVLGKDPEEQELRHRCLDSLDLGLLRVAHVVRHLHSVGREAVLKPEGVDIDGLIRNCLDLLALPLRAIRLELDLAVAAPCRLDGGVLKQILINVVQNAIAGMPDGGELRVVSRAEPGLVVISVHNSGPGIPPGDLERLFEPHMAAHTEVSKCGRSLSVAYALAKRLGGQIRVESRPGEGTLFTIELPGGQRGGAG